MAVKLALTVELSLDTVPTRSETGMDRIATPAAVVATTGERDSEVTPTITPAAFVTVPERGERMSLLRMQVRSESTHSETTVVTPLKVTGTSTMYGVGAAKTPEKVAAARARVVMAYCILKVVLKLAGYKNRLDWKI